MHRHFPGHRFPRSSLILSLLITAFALSGQIAQPPPTPFWIAASNSPPAGQLHFRKTFTVADPILKCVLLAVGNTNLAVSLNDEGLGHIKPSETVTTLELTKGLQPGTNVLRLSATTAVHGTEIAALIELNLDVSGQQWLITDSSWQVGTNAAGPWREPQTRSIEANRNPFDPARLIDAYNSWKLALGTSKATDPTGFTVAPGFKVELIRSALPEEGSWVAMAFDPKGRLTLARESKGLIRVTIPPSGPVGSSEMIEDTLLECRGVLYAYDALYANANNSKGFFRLRDTDGDDRFDETNCLLRTSGGVGHGRNRVVLGPDGAIWLVHGNDVHLTPKTATSSPLRKYQNDALLPAAFDSSMFDGGVILPAGHILQTDRDGTKFELFAGGFRNPLDIAFDPEGEMFTFDADMEWDIGAPWYRPNRVNHVIPGADFGWRRGTMKWPDYYPDTPPPVLDIGLASPTAVEFGHKAAFPSPYKEALFIADWAYGRILAVHLEPEGAGFKGTSELFVSGRPLNVTDMTLGPDGAMYFITGGRRTQSGLYRVTYSGERVQTPKMPDVFAEKRELRRRLQSFQKPVSDQKSMHLIWQHIDDSDPWIRHAARVALEHQPLPAWREKALDETDASKALTSWLALTRSDENPVQIPERLCGLNFNTLTAQQKLLACRILEIVCSRKGALDEKVEATLRHKFGPLYPSSERKLNHQLCKTLVFLKATNVFAPTLALIAGSKRPEDLLHYSFYLRLVPQPWDPLHTREYFAALRRAQLMQGGRDYYSVLQRIREEVVSKLPPAQRTLASHATPQVQILSISTNTVRNWRAEDFDLAQPLTGRSPAQGKAAYVAAQCAVCHRFGEEGGTIGPDLTAVTSRFDRKAILESIIEPSKVIDEKFQMISLTLHSGEELTGTIEKEDERHLVLRENFLSTDTRQIRKSEIRSRTVSALSPMPEGLVNALTRDEILDLLTYLGVR